MKLSTSTLGCFKWDLAETLARLHAYGYNGIDFRGLRGEMQIWKLPEFSSAIKETAARIKDAGLAVSCISSGIRLTDNAPAQMAIFETELERSAEICAALDCNQIRVFGGDLKFFKDAATTDRAALLPHIAERLRNLAQRAKEIAPIKLLVETHDSWTASSDCAALIEAANSPDVACCWDVKHTYWAANETPQTTLRRLGKFILNTHWKDVRRPPRNGYQNEEIAKRTAEHGMLCPTGCGIAPIADAAQLLLAFGYDGWFTLEWEKQWHPHIEEPETAFPEFVKFMRSQQATWERT